MPFLFIMRIKFLFALIFIFLLLPNYSFGKVFLKRTEALKLAFPEAAEFEKNQVFLNSDQVKEIEKIAKAKLDSKLYIFYAAKKDNETLGYALIDTHTLRTTTETVMFVINLDGSLRQAEILAFFEPLDYMPGNKWMNLFNNKPLDQSMRVGKKIPNITGATITTNSFTSATRKILAIFKVALLEKNLLANKEGS